MKYSVFFAMLGFAAVLWLYLALIAPLIPANGPANGTGGAAAQVGGSSTEIVEPKSSSNPVLDLTIEQPNVVSV